MRKVPISVAWLLAAVAMDGAAQAPAPRQVDVAPFIALEVTPKVHLLTTPSDHFSNAIGNVTLIEQSDGFVAVDSGFNAANGRAVVRYARSLASKPIKAVLVTHWHNDHPQGISSIRDAYPKVRIIATRATEAGMRGPEAYDIGYRPDPKFDRATANLAKQRKEALRKLLDDPATTADRKERILKALPQIDLETADFAGSYIVLPTETFERELSIDDRDVPVRLLFLGRANTEGDALAWLPEQKIIVTGDIVVAPFPFGFGSYPADWIETLGKIRALGFATLIPGHGLPQTDASYLDALVAAIADVRAQVGPLAKAGLPIEDVTKKVDFSKSIDRFGTTPRIRLNTQRLFFEPMTGSAYKEALGQPIVQGEGAPPPELTDTPPPSRAIRHKN